MPMATARRPERVHRRLPRRVLALTGGEDLTHDDFIDLSRVNASTGEHFFDGD
jgi:hypothetical protein